MLQPAVVTSAPAPGAPAPAATSTVTVTFVPCSKTGEDKISIIAVPNGTTAAEGALQRQTSGVETYAANVPPGYYTVVAGVLPCSASHDLAVLPGKNRSVVLRGQDKLMIGAGPGALVGTFPDDGVRIVANCAELNEGIVRYSAIVQGGAYYFDSIRSPAKCDLMALAGEADEAPLFALRAIAVLPHAIVRRDMGWLDLYGK